MDFGFSLQKEDTTMKFGFDLNLFTLSEPSEKKSDPFCYACREVICGQAYTCEIQNIVEVWIHESCSKLSPQLDHPFHSQHSLTLLSSNELFICNVCRDLSTGFRFNCKLCCFNVDVKCSSFMEDCSSKYDRQILEERDGKDNIHHFSHKHTLQQCNIYIQKAKVQMDCCYCSQKVDGSYYVCLDCGFFVHDSCMDEMQQKVQHPYHTEHTLLACDMDKNAKGRCHACIGEIIGIGLRCELCNFDLHYPCAKAAKPRLKRPLKHRNHEHTLFYFRHDELANTSIRSCRICREDLNSSIYRCMERTCDADLHLECIPLPSVVDVKCYDGHPLKLVDSVTGCDFLEYNCGVCKEPGNAEHHLYYCEQCIYFAHIDCAITDLIEASQERSKEVGIKHFSHRHTLKQCYFSERCKYNCCCCNKRILGSHFACFPCDFFIHKSCMDEMQQNVQHPYHPDHTMSARAMNKNEKGRCHACIGEIIGIGLRCKMCNFDLHYPCAKAAITHFKRPLMYMHAHTLFYFGQDELSNTNIRSCRICQGDLNSSIYRCMEKTCDADIHLECIFLPPVVQVKCNNDHLLKLVDSINGCDFPVYYCGVCEEPGNPKHHLYYCQECLYFAHVDCVITGLIEISAESNGKISIKHFSHPHDLKLCYFSEWCKYNCWCCNQKIFGSHYACFGCDFFIHKSCMDEMQQKVQNPYHPEHTLFARVMGKNAEGRCHACIGKIIGIGLRCEQCNFDLHYPCAKTAKPQLKRPLKHKNHEHTLFYFRHDELSNKNVRSCRICREDLDSSIYRCMESTCDADFHLDCIPLPPVIELKCNGDHPLKLVDSINRCDHPEYNCGICGEPGNPKHHLYYCEECLYFAHIDCAVTELSKASDERNRKVGLKHFSHQHTLKLSYFSERCKYNCCCCNQRIFGSHYSCFWCDFYIHDSCMDEMRQEVQHPYHPKHTLFARAIDKNARGRCQVCTGKITGISLSCEQCSFDLHYQCAKPQLNRPLTHKNHEHILFYFRHNELSNTKIRSCRICGGDLNSSIYRCMDKTCDADIHLECIPIPMASEVKCHCDNPLKLVDSIGGHDFTDYYCDVCEELGNPKHHLYYCEECLCFAHVECIMTKPPEDDISLADSESSDKVEQYNDTKKGYDVNDEPIKDADSKSEDEDYELEDDDEDDNDELEDDDEDDEIEEDEEEEQYEINSDESSFEHDAHILMKEGTSKLNIDAEVANICDEMETLAIKLEADKGHRASKLQSVILSSRERIMEALKFS